MLIQLFTFSIFLAMWKFWSNSFKTSKKNEVNDEDKDSDIPQSLSKTDFMDRMMYADIFQLLNKIIEMDKALLEKINFQLSSPEHKDDLNLIIRERIAAVSEISTKYDFIFKESKEEYNNFTKQLLSKHPGLSEKELRLSYLVKLRLEAKEIAALEGLTNGSVRVYKTKLKTKLNLSPIQSLTEYLNKFDRVK